MNRNEGSRAIAMANTLVIALTLALATAAPASAADREVATILRKNGGVDALNVEGPRPMATAIGRLIQEYGYRISYEDPRYVYAEDLLDVTAKYSMAEPEPGKKAARLLVPKGGRFSVDVQPAKGPEVMLKQAILASAVASPGQRFQVRKDEGMYHVVPTGARDRNGNQATQTSVLDAPISLPLLERTAYETIVALCDVISSGAGVKVEVGMTGFESWGATNPDEPRYAIGAENEPARAVLKRTLDKIAEKRELMSWMLLYGNQTTENAYALNLVQVPRPIVARTPAAVAPAAAPAATPAATSGTASSSPFDAVPPRR